MKNTSELIRYKHSYRVDCPHNRSMCRCMENRLTKKEIIYQVGNTHASYGWTPKRRAEYTEDEYQIYLEGYKSENS